VIERPVFENSNTKTIEIEKIEMSDSVIVFHIKATSNPGEWIAIDKNTYIKESGSDEKLFFTHGEGINLDDKNIIPKSGSISFKLFFPPLRPEVIKIDYIEDYHLGGWRIMGIHLLPHAPIEPKKTLSRKEVSTLKKYIYPLRTYEPDGGDTKDLRVLDKLIGDSKVVALGEVTHGSSEIFKMKNRIIQYLAINNGFDIFSIEANMPESYKVSDYAVRGVGDPKKLIAGMYFWTWRTEEVLNMVEWMYKFNQTTQRIVFTGFDMQHYLGSINELFDAFRGNDNVEKKIIELKKKLEEIMTRSQQNRDVISVIDSEAKEIDALISFLKNSIEASTFQAAQKAWLQQNMVVIQQFSENNSGFWRDKCMADNVIWIKDQNPNSKLVLWAHNGHIQKTNQMMGAHLSQKLGDDYTTFGFTFFNGSYTAVGSKGLTSYDAVQAYPGTLEYLLEQLKEPMFILDLKKIKADTHKG
jgi:erythromycin esterase